MLSLKAVDRNLQVAFGRRTVLHLTVSKFVDHLAGEFRLSHFLHRPHFPS
jgi:hypothetical protein